MTQLVIFSPLKVFVFCVQVHLIGYILISSTPPCKAAKTFAVSFQGDGSWSTDHWIRYNEIIENVEKELTVCHWEKLRYFSAAVNSVWAYCYIESELNDDLQCWQLYSEANRASAGRTINLIITTSTSSIVAENVAYKRINL